jgi:seryl-tRNA synthetase
MHDIKEIRRNPEEYKRRLARRMGAEEAAEMMDEILRLDAKVRKRDAETQEVRTEQNRVSKEIGDLKRKGGDTRELERYAAALKKLYVLAEYGRLEEFLSECKAEIGGTASIAKRWKRWMCRLVARCKRLKIGRGWAARGSPA